MTARPADVVIIGGGAVGLCCAYYLAKAGLRPAVVERATLGGAASTHNQHIITTHNKVPGPLAELGLRSTALFWQLQLELEDDFDILQNGTLMLYETEEGLHAARAAVDAKLEAGLRMAALDPIELRRLEPALAHDLAGGIVSRGDFQIDPARFIARLGAVCAAKGVRLLVDTPATGIEVRGGRIEAVLTGAGRVPSEVVVCAAGPWSREIGAWVGVDVAVTPRRGMLIETAPAPPVVRHMLLDGGYHRRTQLSPEEQAAAGPLDRYGISFVFLQRPDGRCLLGGSREHVGFQEGTDPMVLDLIRQRQRRFLPGAPLLIELRAFSAFRPYSEDRLPLIGPVPGPAGFFLATGHEGSGLTLAPATGEAVAELIVRGHSSVDLTPLSPARRAGDPATPTGSARARRHVGGR